MISHYSIQNFQIDGGYWELKGNFFAFEKSSPEYLINILLPPYNTIWYKAGKARTHWSKGGRSCGRTLLGALAREAEQARAASLFPTTGECQWGWGDPFPNLPTLICSRKWSRTGCSAAHECQGTRNRGPKQVWYNAERFFFLVSRGLRYIRVEV